MERPIILVIEEAKGAISGAVTDIRANTKLPASIIDGILCSILAEVRKDACEELIFAAYAEKQNIAKKIEETIRRKEGQDE